MDGYMVLTLVVLFCIAIGVSFNFAFMFGSHHKKNLLFEYMLKRR